MVSALSLVLILLVIHQSHQESCDQQLRVYPGGVDVVNVESTLIRQCVEEVNGGDHNCTLASSPLTDESVNTDTEEEGLLVWDYPDSGSLTFHFRDIRTPASIDRVMILYYADQACIGLPSITITSFRVIANMSRHPATGTYNATTVRTTVGSGHQLKMAFNLSKHDFKNFRLSKVEFYSCVSGLTAMMTTEGGNQTLVIVASATVLGSLLLLVLITLLCLICVVLCKRRPTETYRVNRSVQRNAYEVGIDDGGAPKGESVSVKEHEILASVQPKPPADPEYATISEWRKISGISQPQPGVGVINPFYASSSASIPNRCNIADPPGHVDAVESSFSHGDDLKHSCTAHSLQDVRSTGLREGLKEGRLTLSPTGSIGRRTKTFATSYNSGSARNIPPRTVRRNESIKADISMNYKPTPPPRPVLLKRGESLRSVGGSEPYLVAYTQSVNQSSPLTQSMRARKGPEEAASRESKESIEDVGNDNYIIVT